MCLSDTYLDSPVPNDDSRLNLSDFKSVRADNLSVGIYFEESFAVRPVPINSLKECLLIDVFVGNKREFVFSLL